MNVTILDDYFPENDLYVTFGLLVASNDSSDVFVRPGNNQTTVKILDGDHGMCSELVIVIHVQHHCLRIVAIKVNSSSATSYSELCVQIFTSVMLKCTRIGSSDFVIDVDKFISIIHFFVSFPIIYMPTVLFGASL